MENIYAEFGCPVTETDRDDLLPWLVASAMAPMYGVDQDAVMGVGHRVFATMQDPTADVLDQVIWGKGVADGGFRTAFRYAKREGWMEAPLVEDADGEPLGVMSALIEVFNPAAIDARLAALFEIERLIVEAQDLEREAFDRGEDPTEAASVLRQKCDQVIQALWVYLGIVPEPQEEEDLGSVFQPIAEKDPLADRIREAYSDDPKMGDLAVKASANGGGYDYVEVEAADHLRSIEDAEAGWSERVPVYLLPDYDEGRVEEILDRIGERGKRWMRQNPDRQGDAAARVAYLGRQLTDEEKAMLAARLPAIREGLAETWDLPLTEEVQFLLYPDGGVSEEELGDLGAELDGSAADVKRFVELYVGERVAPTDLTWEYWDTQEARRAHALAALTTRCSWSAAAKAGRDAYWALDKSVRGKMYYANVDALKKVGLRREDGRVAGAMVVGGLKTTGLTDGNGKFVPWSRLVKGGRLSESIKVEFGSDDQKARLAAAIKEKIDNPDAQKFAELIQ